MPTWCKQLATLQKDSGTRCTPGFETSSSQVARIQGSWVHNPGEFVPLPKHLNTGNLTTTRHACTGPITVPRKNTHATKLFLILRTAQERPFTDSSAAPLNSCYHRIIGWKRPLRLSSPTNHPTPPCPLNHILKCHIYTFFKHLQGWGLHHLHGQPVPMSDHSFSRGTFPKI